ncbi:DUF6520 family protein [Flavobacterium aquidurense]|uniref:Uncharacterized protein n=1 Tax=Flavobacterium piscis TaxID=1114874 RepID=A0ABU1Y5K6_9FLAO|nr:MULTISPECIES: DUF6520 family protein [Flavobacterium]MDR7208831.1 hypothetical protein [Flavobacterium piscis]
MKTRLLKFILPVVVMGFAAAAAMNAPQNSVKNALVNEVGYIRHSNLTDCEPSDECSPTGSQMCTVGDVPGATRLWKKNQNNQCIVQLFRPQ